MSSYKEYRYRENRYISIRIIITFRCCDVALDSEIDELTMKHAKLEEFNEHLQSQLTDEHAAAVKNNELLKQYSEDMKKVIGSELGKNELRVQAALRDTEDLHERTNTITDTISILGKVMYQQAININFLKIMHHCRNNQIPTVIIQNGMLRQDLEKIEDDLIEHGLELAIKIKNIHTYLQIKSTTCYFSEKGIIVRVKVPHITKGNTYSMYAVERQPFVFEKQVCSVSLEEDYIIEQNGKNILPLSKATKHACITSTLCYTPQYAREFSHDKQCLESSLLGKTTILAIKENCVHRCSPYNFKTPIIITVSEKEYGILYPNSSIKIECKNKPDKIISTKYQVGIVYINLGCFCTAKVADVILRPSHPCLKDNERDADAIITHHISAAWTFSADNQYLNRHITYNNNMSTLVDPTWFEKIPTIKLHETPVKPYTPSFHQSNAHYFSYSTLIMVIILAVVIILIIYKGKYILEILKTLTDPMSLAQKIIGVLFSRPAVTEAYENQEYSIITMFSLEAIKIFLLLCILVIMAVTLYKLLQSRIFSIFTNEMNAYDHGKIKMTMINTSDRGKPAKCIQHTFHNKVDEKKRQKSKTREQETIEIPPQEDIVRALQEHFNKANSQGNLAARI